MTTECNNPNSLSKMAEANARRFTDAGILAVAIYGGPGCGKTTLIEATIQRLSPEVQVAVVTCSAESHLDADKLGHFTSQVAHVRPEKESAVQASEICQAVTELDLDRVDLLFVENVGTMLRTSQPKLGQHLSVAIFSVAGGDDKALKHPELVKFADAVVISKSDLLGSTPFNLDSFRADLHQLNPQAEIFELSAYRGHGMTAWTQWLRSKLPSNSEGESHWFG